MRSEQAVVTALRNKFDRLATEIAESIEAALVSRDDRIRDIVAELDRQTKRADDAEAEVAACDGHGYLRDQIADLEAKLAEAQAAIAGYDEALVEAHDVGARLMLDQMERSVRDGGKFSDERANAFVTARVELAEAQKLLNQAYSDLSAPEAALAAAREEARAEREGILALRVELGARDDETFSAFVRRLSIQSETWRNDLAAAEAKLAEAQDRWSRAVKNHAAVEAEFAAARERDWPAELTLERRLHAESCERERKLREALESLTDEAEEYTKGPGGPREALRECVRNARAALRSEEPER